jgi:uncharacterized protein (TIGR03083 family)
MKQQAISREAIVPALVSEWSAIGALLASLAPSQWARPTALPGWSVQDAVAHLIGTESALAGQSPPPSGIDVRGLPHVRNDIGAVNEQWVQGLRGESSDAVLDRFRAITAVRRAALEAMSAAEFEAPSWTPAGPGTYGRFMRIRVFDCWMHEQDIRDAVGAPGHGDGPCAAVALAEAADALGYIVGKRAAAPDGAAVTIELTGPEHVTWHVLVDGRARLVGTLPGPPTAALRLTSHLFSRLAGGRVPAADHLAEVTVDGDQELGRRVTLALPFTI